jgi:hypothetical protein
MDLLKNIISSLFIIIGIIFLLNGFMTTSGIMQQMYVALLQIAGFLSIIIGIMTIK